MRLIGRGNQFGKTTEEYNEYLEKKHKLIELCVNDFRKIEGVNVSHIEVRELYLRLSRFNVDELELIAKDIPRGK